MSSTIWPPIAPHELRKAEEESLARELAWLLESLQETLASLKTVLDECQSLLSPVEPGSTLVMSSPRSECVKGHVTRAGAELIKGTLHLRLRTYPPLSLTVVSTNPLPLPMLAEIRSLLNQSLDCVDVARWTGDRNSAPFIDSQLRLLHTLLSEASTLLESPSNTWTTSAARAESFDPPLPGNLALDFDIADAALVLTIRVLEPVTRKPDLTERIAFAIGAQRRLEHDEMVGVYTYLGEEVRVREKIRVESADPRLMSLAAKVAAIEHSVQMARRCLSVVRGLEDDDEVQSAPATAAA